MTAALVSIHTDSSELIIISQLQYIATDWKEPEHCL